MMNRFIVQTYRSLTTTSRFGYIHPPKHSETHSYVNCWLVSLDLLRNGSLGVFIVGLILSIRKDGM